MIKKIIFFLCIFFVAVFLYIVPILKSFPQPTGIYFVGTTKKEFMSFDERKLAVRFFYPAEPSHDKYVYLSDKLSYLITHIAQQFLIPKWLVRLMFSRIKTHTYNNASVSSAKSTYPIILFSHGLLGMPSDMYLCILENLASHGYIVAAIDHPYFNVLTVYSDGTSVSSSDLSTQFQKMSPVEQKEFQSKAIDVYKNDMRFVIDAITTINEDLQSIFYHRCNVNEIGIMGHSAGGTAAIELCRMDNRIKACIDLDGWYDHVIGYEPISQPLLLLFGSKSVEITEPTEEYLKRKQISREQYYHREQTIMEHRKMLCNSDTCKMVVLPAVSHGDFGDMVLLKWPLRSLNEPNAYFVIEMINQHIVQFFDNYLHQ